MLTITVTCIVIIPLGVIGTCSYALLPIFNLNHMPVTRRVASLFSLVFFATFLVALVCGMCTLSSVSFLTAVLNDGDEVALLNPAKVRRHCLRLALTLLCQFMWGDKETMHTM